MKTLYTAPDGDAVKIDVPESVLERCRLLEEHLKKFSAFLEEKESAQIILPYGKYELEPNSEIAGPLREKITCDGPVIRCGCFDYDNKRIIRDISCNLIITKDGSFFEVSNFDGSERTPDGIDEYLSNIPNIYFSEHLVRFTASFFDDDPYEVEMSKTTFPDFEYFMKEFMAQEHKNILMELIYKKKGKKI